MELPKIDLKGYEVSRLIAGGNTISGFSHISPAVDKEMSDYYTSTNIFNFLRECESNGINTFQARGDRHIIRTLNEYWQSGGKIQWIAQIASELRDIKTNINQISKSNAFAVFHHGTYTDNLWLTGDKGINEVKDNLKAMRDTGLVVGLGTHRPEILEYVESQDWDVDFYMASLYNLAKGFKHVQAVDGFKEEVFDDNDRLKMLSVVESTKKPCLVFKIYAAGRKTSSPEDLEQAMRFALTRIKPTDAIVVGMYQKYSNQVEQNSNLVRKILSFP